MSTSTINPADFDRDEIELGDGKEGRIYTHDLLDKPLLSVTTVLDCRINPDKKEAIEGWRDWFDGSNERRSPHHKDQLLFKQKRGTLAHYAVLSQLDDDLEWTDEEQEAQDTLKNWADHRPRDKEGNILSVGAEDTHRGEDPWEKCMRDANYFTKEFEKVADEYAINEDSIIDVETYIHNEPWGYSGQFDLLYESQEGETVVCDLKTSSNLYISNKLQTAAYAHAHESDVDRIQVVRIHPDKKEVQVEDDRDWDRSITGLTYEFLSLVEIAQTTKLADFEV